VNENNAITFGSLDALLEKLIIKHGKDKTHSILLYSLKSKNPLIKNDNIIASAIINCAIKSFNLSEKQFKKNNTLTYKKAKATCYFLIKLHTKYSYEDIRDFFDCETIGAVTYGHDKIKEILDQPNIDRDHAQLHKQTGQQVQDFIDQIKN